jgi:transcriptional regulator with XRE-family HTH domain
MMKAGGTKVIAVATAESIGTIALADQLRHLRERIPLSERDVAQATGATRSVVAAWLARESAPQGSEAARLSELIAAVERLEVSTRPEAIASWLRRKVPALEGRTPLQTLRAGGYEQIVGFAEDLIHPPFS